MAIIYGLKVNLSVAMVGMLNHTALKPAADQDTSLKNTTEESNVSTFHYLHSIELIMLWFQRSPRRFL